MKIKFLFLFIAIQMFYGPFTIAPVSAQNIGVCRSPAQYCSQAFEPCFYSYECCSGLCQSGLCANTPQVKCSVPGEFCRFDLDCCTNSCLRGQCTGNLNEKAPVGVNCDYNHQCQSGHCNSQLGVCAGGESACASVGQHCERSSECCTNSCDSQWSVCMATSKTSRHKKRSGVPCRYNFQCPQYCDRGRCI